MNKKNQPKNKDAGYTADQIKAIEQFKAEHEAVLTSRVYVDGGY